MSLFLKYKLPLKLLAYHTALVLLVFSLSFLPSKNPDSSIGFLLTVITMYLIDSPVGMIFEKVLKPMTEDNLSLRVAIPTRKRRASHPRVTFRMIFTQPHVLYSKQNTDRSRRRI
jgi:hypothetical protein